MVVRPVDTEQPAEGCVPGEPALYFEAAEQPEVQHERQPPCGRADPDRLALLWNEEAAADIEEWPDEEDCALLEYQRAWFYDRSQVKVIAKSRQVGITWATACEAIEVAGSRASAGGMDVYFMSISQDDARQFIDDCADWIKWWTPLLDEILGASEVQESDDWFVDGDGNRILAYRIDFPSGFTIYALPTRPARLRGKQGYAIFDEAAQQDIDALMRAGSGLLAWGGRLAFISTYYGTDNAFYKLVQSVKDGKQRASLHEVFIHQALAQGLFKRICRVKEREWSEEAEADWISGIRLSVGDSVWEEEFEGLPSRAGSSLMSLTLINRCAVVPKERCTVVEICGGATPTVWLNGEEKGNAPKPWPLPNSEVTGDGFATPRERADLIELWLSMYLSPALARMAKTGLKAYCGFDYGRTRNLSTKVFGTKDRNALREVGIILELEAVPWPEQDAADDFVWSRLTTFEAGAADSNGIGSNSAERARDRTGGKVRMVSINDGWHQPAFQRVISSFQAERLLIPGHFEPLVDDLASLARGSRDKIVAPQRITKDRRKQKRHADAAFALALFEEAASSTIEEPAPLIVSRQYRPRLRTIIL